MTRHLAQLGPRLAYTYRYFKRWCRITNLMQSEEQILGALLIAKYTDTAGLAMQTMNLKFYYQARVQRHIEGMRCLAATGWPAKVNSSLIGKYSNNKEERITFQMNKIRYHIRKTITGKYKLGWKRDSQAAKFRFKGAGARNNAKFDFDVNEFSEEKPPAKVENWKTWPPTQAEVRAKYMKYSKYAARFLVDPYYNYRRTGIDHGLTQSSIPLPSKWLRRAKKWRFACRSDEKVRISLKNFASDILDLDVRTQGLQYLKDCNRLMNFLCPDEGWKNFLKRQGLRYTRWMQNACDSVGRNLRYLFLGGWARKNYEDSQKSLKKSDVLDLRQKAKTYLTEEWKKTMRVGEQERIQKAIGELCKSNPSDAKAKGG